MTKYNIQNTLSSSRAIALIAGFILSFMFILNVALGNAIMNFISFGVPLNELLIGLLLVILASFGLLKIPTGNGAVFLYIWLSFGLAFWLPIGFFNHGIVAGRDATQLLDATVLFATFSILTRLTSISILKACKSILLLGLTLEFLDRVVLFQLTDITVSSFQEVPLFGGTVGSSVIVTSSFWFGIVMRDHISQASSRYLIFISFVLVLLLQNRFLYVSMITTSIMYLYITKTAFLNKKVLKKISIFFVLLVFFELFIGSLVEGLLGLLPGSEYIESRRLFKYGIETLSLSGIIDHLGTGFGIENELYSGAAGGVFQRLGWWYTIFDTMFSDWSTLFLGMGYGIPLTDFHGISVIREPHNSFVSVFARNGLVLFFMWFIFHASIVFISINSLKKVFEERYEYKLLLVSLLSIISTHVCALVEPAFENPPIAISTYMFIALSLVMLARLKKLKRLHK